MTAGFRVRSVLGESRPEPTFSSPGLSRSRRQVPHEGLARTPAQRSAAQRSAVQRSAAQHSAARRSAAQRSTAQRSAVQHSAAQRSTAKRSTAQRSAVQRSAAQRGAAQRSAAQRGAAQRSAAQRSAAQRSAAQRSAAQRSAAQRSTDWARRSNRVPVGSLAGLLCAQDFGRLGDAVQRRRGEQRRKLRPRALPCRASVLPTLDRLQCRDRARFPDQCPTMSCA